MTNKRGLYHQERTSCQYFYSLLHREVFLEVLRVDWFHCVVIVQPPLFVYVYELKKLLIIFVGRVLEHGPDQV